MQQKARRKGTDTTTTDADAPWHGDAWTPAQTRAYAASTPTACLLVIGGFVVDVTAYLNEHVSSSCRCVRYAVWTGSDVRAKPGGAQVLRGYAIRAEQDAAAWRDASWAFGGGVNNHSRAARRRMHGLRVAKLKG